MHCFRITLRVTYKNNWKFDILRSQKKYFCMRIDILLHIWSLTTVWYSLRPFHRNRLIWVIYLLILVFFRTIACGCPHINYSSYAQSFSLICDWKIQTLQSAVYCLFVCDLLVYMCVCLWKTSSKCCLDGCLHWSHLIPICMSPILPGTTGCSGSDTHRFTVHADFTNIKYWCSLVLISHAPLGWMGKNSKVFGNLMQK